MDAWDEIDELMTELIGPDWRYVEYSRISDRDSSGDWPHDIGGEG